MVNRKIIRQINDVSRLEQLRDMAGFKQAGYLKYGKRKIQVDGGTAKLITELYDKLQNEELKAKLERMLESPTGLYRLAQFVWRHASFG